MNEILKDEPFHNLVQRGLVKKTAHEDELAHKHIHHVVRPGPQPHRVSAIRQAQQQTVLPRLAELEPPRFGSYETVVPLVQSSEWKLDWTSSAALAVSEAARWQEVVQYGNDLASAPANEVLTQVTTPSVEPEWKADTGRLSEPKMAWAR